MPFSGNVETIPLDEVLQFITDNALEGALTIVGGGARLTINFVEGQVFFPFSARRGTYSLGKILRQTGLLSRDALERHMKQLRDDRMAELRDLESTASPEQLEIARRKQYEEEIHDVFLWRRAYFEFTPGAPDEEVQRQRALGKGVTLDPTAFLMEVARRADERRRIRRAIPSGRAVLEVVGDAAAEVARGLKAKGIDLEDGAIDGRTSLEELLVGWGVPHYDALAALAPLVERGRVRPLTLEAAEAAMGEALEKGDTVTAARLTAHLVELGREPATPSELGAILKLVAAPAFRDGPEASLSVRVTGTRAFALVRTLIALGVPFTLITRDDNRERTLASSAETVSYRSSHDDATPTVPKYLRRAGVIHDADLKTAQAASEKDRRTLTDVLIRTGRVSHEDFSAAALEKVTDEVAAFALIPELDVEVRNRAQVFFKAEGAKLSLALPLDAAMAARFHDHVAKWSALLEDVPGEDAIFVAGERAADADPAAKFFGRFDGRRSVGALRRVAKAEPLEFLRFVHGGVKRGYIRRPERDDLEAKLEGALKRGDDGGGLRIAKAGVVFGLGDPFAAHVRDLRARDVAPSPDTRPSIEGDMEGVGLAAVLQGLRGAKRTGTLAISDGKRDQNIYFHRGSVFLLRTEDKEAQEFVDFFLEGDHGTTTMILAGAVDEASMDAAEARKLKDQVLDVLFWEKARFTFQKNEIPEDFFIPPEGSTKVALDTDRFLMEAIRRIEEWDAIHRVLPSGATIVAFTSAGKKLEAIREGVAPEVITLVDGRHTFDDIVRISGSPRLEIGRLLRTLVERGDVAILEPAAAGT